MLFLSQARLRGVSSYKATGNRYPWAIPASVIMTCDWLPPPHSENFPPFFVAWRIDLLERCGRCVKGVRMAIQRTGKSLARRRAHPWDQRQTPRDVTRGPLRLFGFRRIRCYSSQRAEPFSRRRRTHPAAHRLRQRFITHRRRLHARRNRRRHGPRPSRTAAYGRATSARSSCADTAKLADKSPSIRLPRFYITSSNPGKSRQRC